MTARPVPGTEGHRCWACGQTVTGAVCMGPHGDLRSRPEWPRQVCWVSATPLRPAPPEDEAGIPLLEPPAKRGAWPWRCPDCGEVFPSRLHRRLVALTPSVTWHVVGEWGGVERLLRRCSFIGHGVGHGWGEVREWEVTEDGDEDLARFHRPLPEAFAREHGREGMRMRWGIRPPGRAPEHQALCVMPGGTP